MKTVHVRSMDLPKGIPVPHFETIDEIRKHLKSGDAGIVDLINKYGRQKDSLPNSKDWFIETLESLGFKQARADGKPATGEDGEKLESDSKMLDRFVASVVKGTFTVPGFTVTGADDKAKTASVWEYLQGLVDKHGDFTMDLNASSRVGGAKKVPVHCIEAAKRVIANGAKSVAKWKKNFEGGFDFDGVQIGSIPFAPFDTAIPAGAKEEDAAAIRKANETNLARAIAAAFDAKAAKQAVSTFS
jgi:hypothetical protein